MSSAKPEKFSAARLGSLLEAEIADPRGVAYCVAFSGGADSTALLAALAEFARDRRDIELRAVHVDHRLHPESSGWAQRAQAIGQRLGVACAIERVAVATGRGESVEAAARAARYDALARILQPGEILLTAHHLDDQLETVLLQLARGAGVAGLAAMPASAPFAGGRHVRPLLGVPHAELVEYLEARKLEWLDDPMNADPRFDRGFLRAAVIPGLRKRWPAIAANVARSARHMADAQRLLDSLAERDWARARDGSRLDLAGLAGIGNERACNLLRYWIRREGLPLPSAGNLDRLLAMMMQASGDSAPRVNWPGADVRRYRGRLYVAESHELPDVPAMEWAWSRTPKLELGRCLGTLSLATGRGPAMLSHARLPKVLEVRGGAAGAAIRPAVDARRRSLRNLFQEHGVVPWSRGHIPLLYAGKELVAVGNLWSDANFQPRADEPATRVDWHGGPELY